MVNIMTEKNSSINKNTILLDKSPFLTVEQHNVTLPSGTVIPDWTWVTLPDYAVIVAVTNDGNFLCLSQIKYASGENRVIGLSAGMIEKNELPLDGAKR